MAGLARGAAAGLLQQAKRRWVGGVSRRYRGCRWGRGTAYGGLRSTQWPGQPTEAHAANRPLLTSACKAWNTKYLASSPLSCAALLLAALAVTPALLRLADSRGSVGTSSTVPLCCSVLSGSAAGQRAGRGQ